MAKLTVAAAVLVALLALASASAHRTIITTTIEDDNQQGSQSQKCSQQIQDNWQQLQHCQKYLSQRGSSWLAMRTGMNQGGKQQEQHLNQCCSGLQNINDEQCRCQAVEQVLSDIQQQQQQQGQGGTRGGQQQQMEEVMEKARYLPATCNLEPQRCQF